MIRTKTEFANTPCSSCKSLDIEVSEQDIVDYLSLLGAKLGTKIEVISGVAEHGSMVSNLGNVGAILRYNPNYTN
jgi:peptide chain release factor subunit 1